MSYTVGERRVEQSMNDDVTAARSASSAASPASEHTLERNGCPLHAWTAGPPGGTPVALTHGAGTDHRMFEPQLGALHGAGYRTVLWDVRGQGASRPAPGAFSVPAAAEDLEALLDFLHIPEAVLIGQSMGGNIAQDVLLRRPERVLALVAIDCTSNTLPITRAERAELALSRSVMRMWPYDRLTRDMVQASSITEEGRAYLTGAFGQLTRREFLKVWSGVTRSLTPRPDYRITAPTLLIRGEKDATGNIAEAMRRWSERDGCRYEIVAGAGHVSNLDRPQEVDALLLDFLAGLPGGGRTG
jgi:3-oxoadipate enol-lactonase